MEQPHNEHLPMELSSQLVTMMTTEHYNLQTGRSMTISEANGRSSLFVGAVSSGLIALAFVGQISQLGTAFYVFSLVVIPTLLFMGLITFERVLQSGLADFMYARGINRIRHLYLEYAPQMQPYFILSSHDDQEETLRHEAMHTSWWQVFLSTAGMIVVIYAGGIKRIRQLYLEYAPQMQPYFIQATQSDPSFMLSSPNDQQAVCHEVMQPPWWQVFLSMAGMMAVINSVLAGSFVGLLLAAFTLPLWVCTSAGVVAFLVSLVLHQRYQWSQVMRVVRTMRDLFPSQPDMKHTKR